MNGWVNDVADGEWESYSIPLTQANSPNIPSTTTFGSCSSRSSFKVAIIDSGVQIGHEDLPCKDGKEGNNCVGKSFGTTDDWEAPEEQWHGTHVMGIMGATGGNSMGTTSVIPTNNNMCWIVGRVFEEVNSEKSAYLSHVYKAVTWAIASKGAKVINMSLSAGYTTTGQKVMQYAEDKDVIIVAAAGNSNTFQYEYPSSYTNDNVLSVGAVDSNRYVLGVVSTVFYAGLDRMDCD
jgi:thermitase